VIACRYSNLLNKISWVSHFLKKKQFSPFERRFPYGGLCFCYEISATALVGKFCVARGVTQKLRLSSVSFLSVYLSSVTKVFPSR
jgi:hypothetical protein